MDHANAHVMEFTMDPIETKIISSKFTHDEKESSLGKSENLMHNKEQHQHREYYKKLGDEIRNYTDIILFGPTNAKDELFNILKEDHRFSSIKIKIKQADKMTGNQEHAFVKEYFSKR